MKRSFRVQLATRFTIDGFYHCFLPLPVLVPSRTAARPGTVTPLGV